MSRIKVIAGAEKWAYEEARCQLILRSAGFKYIIQQLRLRYHLTTLGKMERREKILRETAFADPIFEVVKQRMQPERKVPVGSSYGLYKDIETLSQALMVDTYFIEESLIGIDDRSRIRDLSGSLLIGHGQPTPDGFYIKIHQHTTLESVKILISWIKQQYKELEKMSEPMPRARRSRHLERYKVPVNLSQKISIYTEIEASMFDQIVTTNADKSYPDDRDAQPYIVQYALEYVAEMLVQQELATSKSWEEELPKLQAMYYQLLQTYAAPSFINYRDLAINLGLSLS